MTSQVQHLRRINAGAGSPPANAGVEGMIALNFPGAPGATGTPQMWAHDGNAWRLCNPDNAPAMQTVSLPVAPTIGAAYTAWAAIGTNSLTGDIVLATYGTPAATYILTNPAQPAVDASWMITGGSMNFATAAEIAAGASTTTVINPAILRGETLNAPTGAGATAADADKIVRLDAQGQIDSAFLKFSSLTYRAKIDVTSAATVPATAWQVGEFGTVATSGTLDPAWVAVIEGAVAGETAKAGDLLIWNGTKYDLLANDASLTDFVRLAGDTLDDGARLTFDTTTAKGTPGGAASAIIIDGDGGTIDAVRLDMGTF